MIFLVVDTCKANLFSVLIIKGLLQFVGSKAGP